MFRAAVPPPAHDYYYVCWTGSLAPTPEDITNLKDEVCARINELQKSPVRTAFRLASEQIEHRLFLQNYFGPNDNGALVEKHRLLLRVPFDSNGPVTGSPARQLHAILPAYPAIRPPPPDRFEIHRPHFFALEALMENPPNLSSVSGNACGKSFLDLTDWPGFSGQYHEDEFFPKIQKALRNLIHFFDDFSKGYMACFGDSTGSHALKTQARLWNFKHTALSSIPERFDGFNFMSLPQMNNIVRPTTWRRKGSPPPSLDPVFIPSSMESKIEPNIKLSIRCQFLFQASDRNFVSEGRIVAFGPDYPNFPGERQNYFHVLERTRDRGNPQVWNYRHHAFLPDPPNSSNPPRTLAPFGKAEIWAHHDIMNYVCTATPFAYVLPLCFKRVQKGMKTYGDKIQKNAVLACVPPAAADLRAASLLDWYFDYDLSLEDLMSREKPSSRIEKAKDKRSVERITTFSKKNRYNGIQERQIFRQRFEDLLLAFRLKMHMLRGDTIVKQAEVHSSLRDACIWCERDEFSLTGDKPGRHGAWLGLGQLRGGFRRPVAIKRDPFGPEDFESHEKFLDVMTLLNPSGYVASATRANVFHCATPPQLRLMTDSSPGDDAFSPGHTLPVQPILNGDGDVGIGCTLTTETQGKGEPILKISDVKCGGGAEASGQIQRGDTLLEVNGQKVTSEQHAKDLIVGQVGTFVNITLSRSPSQPFTVRVCRLQRLYRRWVSEVGICTLQELFIAVHDEERRTQAFRMLLREVCFSLFQLL
jgi:hypothetical protein